MGNLNSTTDSGEPSARDEWESDCKVADSHQNEIQISRPTKDIWEPIIRRHLIDHGLYHDEIIRILRVNDPPCRLKDDKLRKWIGLIQDDIAQEMGACYDETSRKRNLGIAIYRYNALYLKAMEDGNYKEARTIQQRIDRLQGSVAFAESRQSPGRGKLDDEDDDSDDEPDVDLSDLSEEELLQMKEGDGKADEVADSSGTDAA